MNARIRSIEISTSKACPETQPAIEPFSFEGKSYSPEILALMGKAIDAGLFYTDDIIAAVANQWSELFPSIENNLTAANGVTWQALTGELGENNGAIKAMEARLAEAPRGTWALFRRDWNNGERTGTSWQVRISDGQGGCYAPHTGSAEGLPTYANALRKLEAKEIYDAKLAETQRRERDRSRSLIQAHGWKPGQTLRKVHVAARAYSSATITNIRETGFVELELTRRGSRKRNTWSGLAQSIRFKDLPDPLPPAGTLVATER